MFGKHWTSYKTNVMIKDFFTYGHGNGMSCSFGVDKERGREIFEATQTIFNGFVSNWKTEAVANKQSSRLDIGEVIHAALQQDLNEQEEALVLFALGGFVEELKGKQRVQNFINSL